MAQNLQQLIDGEWVPGDGPERSSLNPARPDVPVATYTACSESQTNQAIEIAASAGEPWGSRTIIDRALVLRKAADILHERSGAIAALLTAEEGKTTAESIGELAASVETLHYHAAQARSPQGVTYASSSADELIRTVRRPLGTLGVITPWNFPVMIPVWKIAPALLHGNCVVWKPASDTPAVAAALAEVFVDAGVPAGVLSLLLGPGAIGSAIVENENIAAVTFTGSVPVGRQIAVAATARGAKVQTELGGHSAAIVCPGVDPQAAAESVIAGAMGSTGQKCTATRRIIAVGDSHGPLVEAMKEIVMGLAVGDGADKSTRIGPLVSEKSAKEVGDALSLAGQEGAEVLAQTHVDQSAPAYFAPTLLSGDPKHTISREEVFGPISTVLRVDSVDEAIHLANDTDFGLTAAIFSNDERTIRRCVDRVEAGLIKINGPTTGSEIHVPFGGLKGSSFPAPREQNAESAADFFTWSKSAYLRTIGRP